MSGGDIDSLLKIWAETSGEAPFQGHNDLYQTIDAIPLSDSQWQSFTLKYSGDRPDDNVPEWMDKEHEVWFRDPHELVHNILSNSDFKDDFDYVPYQEYDVNGTH